MTADFLPPLDVNCHPCISKIGSEPLCITCRSQDCRSAERANARRRHQPSRPFVSVGDVLDLDGNVFDPCLEAGEIIVQVMQNSPRSRRQIIGLVIQDPEQIDLEDTGTLPDRNAVLQAVGSHLTDQVRSVCDKSTANTMQHLQIDLIGFLHSDKAHCWPGGCLRDGLRVYDVVLVGLDVGFTNWAGMIRTSCPACCSLRASHWDPGHASMPTKVGLARSKNCISVSRRNLAFWMGTPAASRPTTWNTFLPISTPKTAQSLGPLRIMFRSSFSWPAQKMPWWRQGGPSH
jgi:hypothetical protein